MTAFTDKTVLITGGSSGIGLATANQLAAEGAHLWLLARREEQLAQAKLSVRAHCLSPRQQVETISADVALRDQIEPALETILARSGPLDILINAAGITYPGDVEVLGQEIFDRLTAVNFLGLVHVTKLVLPGMLKRGSGSIVNVASMGGVIGLPGYTAYAGSKAAVKGFSDALRAELKPKGIHVAIVFPPDTDTPQLREELPLRSELANFLSSLDKVMQPEEVAGAILNGLRKRKYMIIPGAGNLFFFWLAGWTGTYADAALDLFIAWANRKIEKSKQKKQPG